MAVRPTARPDLPGESKPALCGALLVASLKQRRHLAMDNAVILAENSSNENKATKFSTV